MLAHLAELGRQLAGERLRLVKLSPELPAAAALLAALQAADKHIPERQEALLLPHNVTMLLHIQPCTTHPAV